VPATCVIGLQWGDEAKGKLVDLLAPKHDTVVRYQGGANAGHTVVSGENVYKLHHIPSGILHPQVTNIIAPGVVIEPTTLLKELDGLLARGLDPYKNLFISERAHLVMPWHIAEDQIGNQQVVSGESIGSTLRGIGPCYRDKVGRHYAVRLADILSPNLRSHIETICAFKQRYLSAFAQDPSQVQLDAGKIFELASGWADRLRPLTKNTTEYLLDQLDTGKQVLMEGAQGSLLDIDHGTFPFVTSSNASGVGVSNGSGIPGKWITNMIGVCKAYSTRVGGGPFPTELHDATGQKIRDIGREYGTTTGRPRRCGWFDAVAVRYAARLGGIDRIALMMMDVLSHFDEIQVNVGYELDGKRIEHFPCLAEDLRRIQPAYETLPGWNQDVTGIRSYDDLPDKAKSYIQRISDLVGVAVGVVSVGPDREQTMFLA
jgi:adenylosuccinate synthase